MRRGLGSLVSAGAGYVPEVLVALRVHHASSCDRANAINPELVLFQRLVIWSRRLHLVSDPQPIIQAFRKEALTVSVANCVRRRPSFGSYSRLMRNSSRQQPVPEPLGLLRVVIARGGHRHENAATSCAVHNIEKSNIAAPLSEVRAPQNVRRYRLLWLMPGCSNGGRVECPGTPVSIFSSIRHEIP
jgi:hypothetical protein